MSEHPPSITKTTEKVEPKQPTESIIQQPPVAGRQVFDAPKKSLPRRGESLHMETEKSDDFVYGNSHLTSRLEGSKGVGEKLVTSAAEITDKTTAEAKKHLTSLVAEYNKRFGKDAPKAEPKPKKEKKEKPQAAAKETSEEQKPVDPDQEFIFGNQHLISRIEGKKSKGKSKEAGKEAIEDKEEQVQQKPLEAFPGTDFEYGLMKDVEKEYLAVYKEQHKDNGLTRSIKKAFNSDSVKRFEEVKGRYSRQRQKYADALSRELRKDLEAKGVPEEDIKRQIILESERRTMIESARERNAVRREALDHRKKTVLGRLTGALHSGNEWLDNKLGKKNARVVKAVISAGVITTGAAFLGAFGATGVMGLLGFGAFKVARSLGGMAAGIVGGNAAAEFYGKHNDKGIKEKAEKALEELRKNYGKMSLEEYEKQYHKLNKRISGQALEERKAMIRVITALAVGGTVSVGAGLFEGGLHIPGMGGSHGSTFEATRQAATEGGKSAAKTAAETAASAAKTAESATADIFGKPLEHGWGADHMFKEFQDTLRTTPGLQQSELIKNILNQSPHKLSEALKFPMNNGEGIMQPGDSLEMKGSELIFHRGHKEWVLMKEVVDENGKQVIEVHDKIAELHEALAEGAHHATHHANAHHSESGSNKASIQENHPGDATSTHQNEAAANAKTAELNQEQASAGHEALDSYKAQTTAPETHADAPVAAPDAAPAPDQDLDTSSAEAATAAPAAEVASHIVHNHYNLDVNTAKSVLYADSNNNLIQFGGTLNKRLKDALDLVNADHKKIIYLDSSDYDIQGRLQQAHVTRVFWNPDIGQVQAPNETMDPTLIGIPTPTAEDLARVVNP